MSAGRFKSKDDYFSRRSGLAERVIAAKPQPQPPSKPGRRRGVESDIPTPLLRVHFCKTVESFEITGKGRFHRGDYPLDDALQSHLDGESTVLVNPVSSAEETGFTVVRFDLSEAMDHPFSKARQYADEILKYGIPGLIEVNEGGKGHYLLWIFHEQPVPAVPFSEALIRMGNRLFGVILDTVPPVTGSALIPLPLQGESVLLQRRVFVNAVGKMIKEQGNVLQGIEYCPKKVSDGFIERMSSLPKPLPKPASAPRPVIPSFERRPVPPAVSSPPPAPAMVPPSASAPAAPAAPTPIAAEPPKAVPPVEKPKPASPVKPGEPELDLVFPPAESPSPAVPSAPSESVEAPASAVPSVPAESVEPSAPAVPDASAEAPATAPVTAEERLEAVAPTAEEAAHGETEPVSGPAPEPEPPVEIKAREVFAPEQIPEIEDQSVTETEKPAAIEVPDASEPGETPGSEVNGSPEPEKTAEIEAREIPAPEISAPAVDEPSEQTADLPKNETANSDECVPEPPPAVEPAPAEIPAAPAPVAAFVFRRNGMEYGIAVDLVETVAAAGGITPLPGTGNSVRGMLSAAGRTVTVLDLGVSSAGEGSSRSRKERVIVLNARVGEIGLLADGVSGMASIPGERITPMDGDGCLGGMADLAEQGRSILLPDVDRLIALAAGEPRPAEGKPKAAPGPEPHVLFSGGGMHFALPARSVREILAEPPADRNRGAAGGKAPAAVSWRGGMLPVIDIRAAIPVPESGAAAREGLKPARGRILVLRADDAVFGVRVDAVAGIRSLAHGTEGMVRVLDPEQVGKPGAISAG